MLKKLLRMLGFSKKVARQDSPIGEITHFYGKLGVAIVRFDREISVGKNVTFQGATTDFSQNIDSLELDHKSVSLVPKGKEVGIKVSKKVREGDKVFLN